MRIAAHDIKNKIDVTILQFVAGAGFIMAVCMKQDGTLYEVEIKNLIITGFIQTY